MGYHEWYRIHLKSVMVLTSVSLLTEPEPIRLSDFNFHKFCLKKRTQKGCNLRYFLVEYIIENYISLAHPNTLLNFKFDFHPGITSSS